MALAALSEEDRARLTRHRIRIREERVIALEGRDGSLDRIVFDGGEPLPRRALFFTTGQFQRSELAVRLGCEFNDKGTVRTGKYESTHLPACTSPAMHREPCNGSSSRRLKARKRPSPSTPT